MLFDHLSHSSDLNKDDINALVAYINDGFPIQETPYLVVLFRRAADYFVNNGEMTGDDLSAINNALLKGSKDYEGSINIYLDDVRPTPEGFVHCRWPDELSLLVELFDVNIISLDHDLGDDDRGTGNTAVNWLEEYVFLNDIVNIPQILVHSDNGPGIQKMRNGINQIQVIAQRNRSKAV